MHSVEYIYGSFKVREQSEVAFSSVAPALLPTDALPGIDLIIEPRGITSADVLFLYVAFK